MSEKWQQTCGTGIGIKNQRGRREERGEEEERKEKRKEGRH